MNGGEKLGQNQENMNPQSEWNYYDMLERDKQERPELYGPEAAMEQTATPESVMPEVSNNASYPTPKAETTSEAAPEASATVETADSTEVMSELQEYEQTETPEALAEVERVREAQRIERQREIEQEFSARQIYDLAQKMNIGMAGYSTLLPRHVEGEPAEDANAMSYDEFLQQLRDEYGTQAPSVNAETGDTAPTSNVVAGEVPPAEATSGETTEATPGSNDEAAEVVGNGVVPGTEPLKSEADLDAADKALDDIVDEETRRAHEEVPGREQEVEKSKEKLLDRFRKTKFGKALLKSAAMFATTASILGVMGAGGVSETTTAPAAVSTEMAMDDAEEGETGETGELLDLNEAYKGRFSNAEGTGVNLEKEGALNFNESLDNLRAKAGPEYADMSDAEFMQSKAFLDTIQQAEAHAFALQALPSTQENVPAIQEAIKNNGGKALTEEQLSRILESNPEARQQAYDSVAEWVGRAEASESSITGRTYNAYMRSTDGASFADHERIDGVQCITYENASPVVVLRYGDEEIVVKKECIQIVSMTEIPGVPIVETPGNPETPDTPDTSTPDNPDNPDTPSETPETPPPDGGLDPKKAEEERIKADGEHNWLEEEKGAVTDVSDRDSMNEYDIQHQNNGDRGTSQGDVAPEDNIQTGAVDTENTQSVDGTGRTIQEGVDQADRSNQEVANQQNGESAAGNWNENLAEQQAARDAYSQNETAAEQSQQNTGTIDGNRSEFRAGNY